MVIMNNVSRVIWHLNWTQSQMQLVTTGNGSDSTWVFAVYQSTMCTDIKSYGMRWGWRFCQRNIPMKSTTGWNYRAWCTQMLEPASLGLNSLSFISCVMRDNFLFFQRHVVFYCKMVMIVHVTKRCCKDCVISVHVIFLGHTNWSWRW